MAVSAMGEGPLHASRKRMAGGVVELWREKEKELERKVLLQSARGETFPLLRRR
jgi:hypothetical protein